MSRNYYPAKRIYLPQKLAETVDEFERKLATVLMKHQRACNLEGKLPAETWVRQIDEISEMIDKKVPPLFVQLEAEFRKLLGWAEGETPVRN
jgi:hypothetical protein